MCLSTARSRCGTDGSHRAAPGGSWRAEHGAQSCAHSRPSRSPDERPVRTETLGVSAMGGSEDGRMRGQALPGRPNRFEVDLGAIAHNAATIRRLVGPSCKIFAALKADAYGYGIAAVAPAVAAAGVDGISRLRGGHAASRA